MRFYNEKSAHSKNTADRDKADLTIECKTIDIKTIPCPKCNKVGFMVHDGRNSEYSNGMCIQRYVCTKETRDAKTGFMCGGTIDLVEEDRISALKNRNNRKYLKRDSKGRFVKTIPVQKKKGGKKR